MYFLFISGCLTPFCACTHTNTPLQHLSYPKPAALLFFHQYAIPLESQDNKTFAARARLLGSVLFSPPGTDYKLSAIGRLLNWLITHTGGRDGIVPAHLSFAKAKVYY